MSARIKFLGAAGTVTGSKYLFSWKSKRLLVDAGIFQGDRRWREENWRDMNGLGVDLEQIDAVLLTHAHIDHSGMLPRFFKLGLRAPIYCTQSTYDLLTLLLPDSGRLQEEEASYRAERGKSRHKPPLPLYTEADAEAVLKLIKPIRFDQPLNLADQLSTTWTGAGHILGAGSIALRAGDKLITFSGDIGRYTVPILRDPQPAPLGDLLLIESTYGNTNHDPGSPAQALKRIVNDTVKRGGVLVIPSFAVGRTQLLLFYLRELKASGEIPDLPVIIDSPMARDVTSIYGKYSDEYDPELGKFFSNGGSPFHMSRLTFVRDKQESIRLNSVTQPMVIISASGMLSGGRILHHLKQRISDPRNTILFVGYQPPGGRGAWIKSGAASLKLVGDEVPIRAQISEISGLSAHGDRSELLRWARACHGLPNKVAVVHGERPTAEAFSQTLRNEMGWNSFVPEYLQEIEV